MRGHLTERQLCTLRCISEWIAEHREASSIREIDRQVGLSSPPSVAYHLTRLEAAGAIKRVGLRRFCRSN
ncbi:hypothetical protein [Streptomyces sp. NPDC017529]|uniref:LexA family protein n=1 Tax=Streptomyces sp. NPDC017529 TaxID=3365000 RepID=UPI0037AC9A5D